MRNIFLRIILFSLIGLFLQSCSKVVRDNYTYMLKGRVVDRSSLNPVPQFEIILLYPDGYMDSGAKEIGRTISDNNGNFIFEKLALKYHKNLMFKHGNAEIIYVTPVPKPDDTADIVDVKITP